jgi:hypothetical protein
MTGCEAQDLVFNRGQAQLDQRLFHALPDIRQYAGLARGVVAVYVAVNCAAVELTGLSDHIFD